MRENEGYDFRVALTNTAGLTPPLINQATMDGATGLALNAGAAGASVFGVYNRSVLPNLSTVPVADMFDEGFDTLLQSGGAKTDFVLNEDNLWEGNEDFADLSYERIPFQIAYDADSGSTTTTFEWRPDPAMYVAVMTGNLEIIIEDCTVNGTPDLDLQVSYYVSGWKSIMGNPENKKRSNRKGRK